MNEEVLSASGMPQNKDDDDEVQLMLCL